MTETAHVCVAGRQREAVDNSDLGVGFPIKDVKFLGAQQNEAANWGGQKKKAPLGQGLV